MLPSNAGSLNQNNSLDDTGVFLHQTNPKGSKTDSFLFANIEKHNNKVNACIVQWSKTFLLSKWTRMHENCWFFSAWFIWKGEHLHKSKNSYSRPLIKCQWDDVLCFGLSTSMGAAGPVQGHREGEQVSLDVTLRLMQPPWKWNVRLLCMWQV